MNPLRRILVAHSVLLSFIAFASPGRAQERVVGTQPSSDVGAGPAVVIPSADGFGATGQWVFSLSDPAEFPFILNKTGGGPWHVLVQPSADTFIAPHVSVGGLVKFERSGGNTDVGVGARAGYDVKLTDLVSVWIRGGLFYHHFSPDMGPPSSQTLLDIKVPALFHLVPHFFLGVGPTISLILQHSSNQNGDATLGLMAIVGGYL